LFLEAPAAATFGIIRRGCSQASKQAVQNNDFVLCPDARDVIL
jgi:hypothetical protein